jgi:hypothetical protein
MRATLSPSPPFEVLAVGYFNYWLLVVIERGAGGRIEARLEGQ